MMTSAVAPQLSEQVPGILPMSPSQQMEDQANADELEPLNFEEI